MSTGGVLLVGASIGFGQEVSVAAPPITEAERVIVTGSNIPTAGEVGPNPVLTINRDYIEKSGERTAEELIRNTTVAGPNGVPASNNSSGATPGASSISLRGFDPSDTLTLIDGRRIAPYPLGTGNGAQTFVDLNSIPRAAIESIEILKDGASSTYGADAIAGVVNIKLRHDYRGAETNVEYGNTLDKDSGEFAASLVFGSGDDKTSVTGVLSFYHRNSIYNHDRGYSSTTPFPSTSANPFNLELSLAAVLASGVPEALLPHDRRTGLPLMTFFGHAPFFTNGEALASDYVYRRSRAVHFNYNAYSEALPDSERYGAFVNATHKVCGDQMVLYADMFYQNVKTHYDLAPTATSNFDTPGNVILAIPPHAPGPVLGGPSYEHTGVPVGAFNPFNRFQQIISGGTRGRLIEFGNRLLDNQTDAFFSTLGVKGDKLFDGSWGYDAGFRYSQIGNTSTATLQSASRFNRILNAADPIFDPASSQFIGTTIPYNPFGDYRRPIAANALPVDFATIHPKEIDLSKLATLELNVYTTSLFNLPAAGVGLAFGGQFRRENLEQNPDDSLLHGDILSTGPGNFTHAGRKIYAFYAETSLPIFSSAFNAPGFHALEFTAAARFEEFRNNDTNVLVPKVGVRWQPLDDSLTVRATWGEGFHEASLIESFGAPFQGFTNELQFGGNFDPVTHTRFGEVPFIVRSNPNLQPEDSRSFSGGIVYTPKFVQGLTVTIDIFDIESKGRVTIPPIQNLIDRSVIPGQSLPLEKINRDANGEITSIELAYENSGSQKARGADFGLQYQLPTRFGTFTSLTQATYLDSFQFAFLPGQAELEQRSSVPLVAAGSDEGYLKWKGNSRLDWAWHGFDLGATAHYLDGFHEIFFTSGQVHRPLPDDKHEHWVKQTWFFDVQLSYNFTFSAPIENQPVAGYSKGAKETPPARDGKSLESAAAQTANFALPCWKKLLDNSTVTLGCNNVFGHDPPDANATANYADFLYDSTGRFVYVSLRKKF
ncbi:MAG: iron complex outerrane recepter protein [Verrucomicrobiota bacterium]